MSINDKNPTDFFGDIGPDKLKEQSEWYTMILREIYEDAERSRNNIVRDAAFLYDKSTPLFEIVLEGTVYKFYEHFFQGEVANLYRGTNGDYLVFLKVAINPADNELINEEFKLLSTLKHRSLPVVEKKLMVNSSSAFIMRAAEGTPLLDLMKEYPNGVPAEHVMWMLERIFSVVGYLHYNKVVHGNIKPEHIIINKNNHNVSLLGYSLCITEADKPTAMYKVFNDFYSAPEVSKSARVLPKSDIYSIGKIAVLLLGGNVQNNDLPPNIDEKVRLFIRRLVTSYASTRPNDAWKLWNDLIELRTDVFGTERFKLLP